MAPASIFSYEPDEQGHRPSRVSLFESIDVLSRKLQLKATAGSLHFSIGKREAIEKFFAKVVAFFANLGHNSIID